MSHYLFNNAGEQAGRRFTNLEILYDRWTTRHLEATGLGPGWRCWEAGGGGGSIATWLAARCGPAGHVLVTDIDPRFLAGLATQAASTIEVQRHDISADPLPSEPFDLIHARLVLLHVPAREQALQRLVAALRPGGWLVIEDFDPILLDQTYPTTDTAAAALFRKMRAAQQRLMAAHSGEGALSWERTLYQRLQAQGLTNIGMEGYLAIWEGKSSGTQLMRANFEQIRAEAIQAGLISPEEVDQVLAYLDDPAFTLSAPMLFTACGRKPLSLPT